MDAKRALSISKKYFTIPPEHLAYYPKVIEGTCTSGKDSGSEDYDLPLQEFLEKRKRHQGAGLQDKRHKILREQPKQFVVPAKARVAGSNTESILSSWAL